MALLLGGSSLEDRASATTGGVSGPSGAAVLAVAPAGNDSTCARGVLSRPCSSFDKAYRLARCGDTIKVTAGRYGPQQVNEVGRLSACSTNVTFRASPAASAVIEQIDFGGGVGTTYSPDRITLEGLAVSKIVNVFGDVEHVTLKNIDGGAFAIQGARNLRVLGGDWGPCDSSGPSACRSQSFIIEDRRLGELTRNVTVDGAVIHDYRVSAAGDHFECLFTTGGTNVVIRNSSFYNCETYGIATGARDWARYDGWLVENNWFGRTCCFGPNDRDSAIVIGGPVAVANMTIRFNSFATGQSVVSEGGIAGPGLRIAGNILASVRCVPNARYSGNLVSRSGCGKDDRNSIYGYRYDGVRLRVDGVRARAVRMAYAEVANGSSLRAAARAAARAWKSPPSGGWSGRTLRHLLADEVYLGRRLGRQSEHTPLVSRGRWQRVQRALTTSSQG